MHFAYNNLYLWTYFKETYIIFAPQMGPTAQSYIPWYVFQLMYFAISENFL